MSRSLLAGLLLFTVASVSAPETLAQSQWTPLVTVTDHPRIPEGMGWDPSTGNVYLAVSEFQSGVVQMWVYDGIDWALIPSTSSPPRQNADIYRAAWDPNRRRMVLFGNQNTWEWDATGASWTQMNPAVSPSDRRSVAMVYDEARGEMLLFGGQIYDTTISTSVYYNELWSWNGTTWSQIATVAPQPRERSWTELAYDSDRQVVVMHGGWYTYDDFQGNVVAVHLGDTWEWNGSSWTSVNPSGPAIKAHSMAYDPDRQRMVIFGGSPSGSFIDTTYELVNGAWSLRYRGPPGPRNNSVMIYDELRQYMLMTGGYHSFDDWLYVNPNLASSTPFGAGCAGSAGTPTLTTDTSPWLGDAWEIDLANIPASGPALLALGTSDTSWLGVPLPFSLNGLGAPGCSALVSLSTLFPLNVAGGAASLDAAIPVDTLLLGQHLYLQALAQDGAANTLGWTFSNGIDGTFGLR